MFKNILVEKLKSTFNRKMHMDWNLSCRLKINDHRNKAQKLLFYSQFFKQGELNSMLIYIDKCSAIFLGIIYKIR